MGDDDRKLSYSELDKLRRERRSDDRGGRRQGKAAQARSDMATKQYLQDIDKLFSSAEGGTEGEALAKAVRDAHGTPELDDACREYREKFGIPKSPDLLSLFLDCRAPDLVIATLDALIALMGADDDFAVGRGVQSQLRTLAQGFDNDIAERAEEILEGL